MAESHPFHANLKRLRESRNLTRYRLAKDARVSAVTLGRMESGERTPNMATLCRLADVLNCTLDELCGRTPPSRGTKS